MRALLPVLLLVAAGAAGWLALTRPAPTLERLPEPPPVYAPAPSVLTRAPLAGEYLVELEVAGMCCDNCTGKLHGRLGEQSGVLQAAVDFERGLAQAIVEQHVAAADLARALTFDKYSAVARQ